MYNIGSWPRCLLRRPGVEVTWEAWVFRCCVRLTLSWSAPSEVNSCLLANVVTWLARMPLSSHAHTQWRGIWDEILTWSCLLQNGADKQSSVQTNIFRTQEVKTKSPSTPSSWRRHQGQDNHYCTLTYIYIVLCLVETKVSNTFPTRLICQRLCLSTAL